MNWASSFRTLFRERREGPEGGKAMAASLADIGAGNHPHERLIGFAELCRVVGFDDYYAEEARYSTDTPAAAPKRGAAE